MQACVKLRATQGRRLDGLARCDHLVVEWLERNGDVADEAEPSG
ncbi:hypothetical protein [Pyrinomonas sp.]